MTYVLDHWSFDPMLVIIAVTGLAHGVGLRRLNARSRPVAARRRNRRSAYFYASLAVLALTISSPVDYWSSDYLYVHMIEHVLLAFAFPVLLVAGAPWVPLWHVLPVGPAPSGGSIPLPGPRHGRATERSADSFGGPTWRWCRSTWRWSCGTSRRGRSTTARSTPRRTSG